MGHLLKRPCRRECGGSGNGRGCGRTVTFREELSEQQHHQAIVSRPWRNSRVQSGTKYLAPVAGNLDQGPLVARPHVDAGEVVETELARQVDPGGSRADLS